MEPISIFMYSLRLLFSVTTCYYGNFCMFFLAGFPSPTQKELMDAKVLSEFTLPIFASAPYIGIVFGSLILAICIDRYVLAIMSLFLSAVGWNCIIIGYSSAFIILGTILVGLKNGIMSNYLFAYFPEICLERQWKFIGGGIGLSLRMSVFVSYFFGIFLSYRWLAVFGIVVDLLFFILLLFLPTSPAELVRQNNDDRAKRVLTSLHGDAINCVEELSVIKDKLRESTGTNRSLSELKNWDVLKPIFIVSILQFFKEFGGHEAIVVFSSIILENEGMNPKVSSLFYPIFLLIGSVASIFLVKYFSLSRILFLTTALQALAHLSMAVYFFTSIDILYCNSLPSTACEYIVYWAVANIALYALAFSTGWGTILFTLFGIMIQVQKERSIAIVSIIAASSDVIFPFVFYTLYVTFGEFWSFISIVIILFLALLFQYLFINID